MFFKAGMLSFAGMCRPWRLPGAERHRMQCAERCSAGRDSRPPSPPNPEQQPTPNPPPPACEQVAVCVFAFDCLSLNGRTLLREPLTARREALYSALEESEGHLQFATVKVGGWKLGGTWVEAGWGWCEALYSALEESKGHLQSATAKVGGCQGGSWMGGACCAVLANDHCCSTPSPSPQTTHPSTPPLTGRHLELQTSRDVEELTRFLDESVEAGTEGLIVKTVAGGPFGWICRRAAALRCAMLCCVCLLTLLSCDNATPSLACCLQTTTSPPSAPPTGSS